MLKTVKTYSSFNQRRYSDPWVAKVTQSGNIDFSKKIGGYTGGYKTGDAGELYIEDPEEGSVYAYGQKDYRGGKNTEVNYVLYQDGEFRRIEKTDIVKVLNGEV